MSCTVVTPQRRHSSSPRRDSARPAEGAAPHSRPTVSAEQTALTDILAVLLNEPGLYSLAEPALSVEHHQDGEQLTLAVTAQTLARFVELSLDGVDVVFSDNYFDLPAGRTVTATCPLPTGWTLDRVRSALRVHSLYDSFTR